MSTQWHQTHSIYEIPNRGILLVQIDDEELLLTRSGEQVRCYANSCSHLERPIDMGKVVDGVLTCPFHQYRFVLEDGRCLNDPDRPLQQYPVRIKGDGHVEVELPA